MKEYYFETILNCVSASLFEIPAKPLQISNVPLTMSEAIKQTVFPLVYSTLCGDYDLSQYQSNYYGIIANNVKVTEEHKKLHKLLSDGGIPYVILKGCASARYYPDPLLRTMGDVDILVNPEDTEKADKLLLSAGYTKHDDTESSDSHIGYVKDNGIVCELHRKIKGIPKTQTGNKISALFSDIFDNSVLKNGEFRCPSDFHHGLILLLHTATHLTHEGIGLRHLCDWAVFTASFSDEEFLNIFEKPLKDVGLWKFAQILTQCAIKHLGSPQKTWVGEYDEAIIDGIVADIFNSGNFGKKDLSRYQQIKYISSRSNSTPDSASLIKSVIRNMVAKTKKELPFIKKAPFLLPLGFAIIILKYLWLIIIGKRKFDNKQLIDTANTRKNLYQYFDLFEK